MYNAIIDNLLSLLRKKIDKQVEFVCYFVFTINFRVHYFGELRSNIKETQRKSFLTRKYSPVLIITTTTVIFDSVPMTRQIKI